MSPFKTLLVYLGSSGRCRDVYKDATAEFAAMLGARGKALVYGGMDVGLMGILASGAIAAGVHVTGVIPKSLKESERVHPRLQETILVHDLWERKNKMFRRGQAIVALPGGFGTFDEMLEVLYWGALGLHGKPMVLVNIEGYWDEMIGFLESLEGYDRHYVLTARTLAEVFDLLDGWTPPRTDFEDKKLPHFEDEILREMVDPLIVEGAHVRDAYYLASALDLKQLNKHQRPVGILNSRGQFDALLRWFEVAERERFLTDRCKTMFAAAQTRPELLKKLSLLEPVHIDLQHEKWGITDSKTHIEIRETE
jgi:hypothetical protein